MKTAFSLAVLAVLLVAPGRCFALWGHATVSKETAKGLGMEVRAQVAGLSDVRVELEFKTDGELKGFSRVDFWVGEGGKLLTAPLREDRSTPGRVVVSLTADRTLLDKITLRVMVPGSLGGMFYEVRVKDFVDLEKLR
jgi:hypothetical protein